MLKTIDEIRDTIISKYEPDRIILFGSRATGTATETSDIDLLILKDTRDRPLDRRIQVETLLADRAVPIDIVVYTPQEMNYLFSIGSPFVEEVIETGRVLYMRKATESWIREAEEELSSASILLDHGKYKAACYHCQQSVEKGLKALILEKGDKPDKTHDIVEMLSRVQRLGYEVALPMDDAVLLNSIYKGRYPTDEGLLPQGEPTKADANRVASAAERFLKSARELLEK
ncbi:MAG: HEPN domain-containing protein [Nitrospirae bacterium]|nr:HEPN domain-containing protein [Nitrospirota bacterium]